MAELSELATQGKPIYGSSPQPEWVQKAAAGNSTWSALKFGVFLSGIFFRDEILTRISLGAVPM